MGSILYTWIFHQFICIYQSKSHNWSQVYIVSLAICGLEIMYRLIRIATRRLIDTHIATYRLVELQLINCLTCKLKAHILESFQIKSCVNCICKLLSGLCRFFKRKFKLSTQIQYTFFLLAKCHLVSFFRQEINK